MSYSKVPDAEAPAPAASDASTYPDANATELKLLTFLDGAMKNAKPSIPLPQISTKDVGPPPTMAELFAQLKAPAIAFGVSLTSALIVIFLANPVVEALYPYYACIVTFIGSLPTMKARAAQLSGVVFSRMTSVENEVNTAVTDLSNMIQGVISSGKANVDDVLNEYKPKITLASKMESTLKKMDPELEIPDVSSIEGVLDSAADSVTNAFKELEAVLDIEKMIPAPLQSEANFEKLAFYPVMGVLLAMQLFSTYKSTQTTDASTDDAAAAADDAAAAADDAAATDDAADSNQYAPVMAALSIFSSSVFSILIAFLLTQAVVIAKLVNTMINTIGGKVNAQVDAKLGAVCLEVFGKIHGGIKSEILMIMKKMAKLEKPLKKLPHIPGM